MKICKLCAIEFKTTPQTRNRKYCEHCKIIIRRKQKRDSYNSRKSFDLFCLRCGESLGINDTHKQYCEKCLPIQRREYRQQYHISKTMKGKLDKFYKNQRYIFLQCPYITDVEEIVHNV